MSEPRKWRIAENTLALSLDRWEDPGDYPSAAGSSPMGSYIHIDEITGHLILKSSPPFDASIPIDRDLLIAEIDDAIEALDAAIIREHDYEANITSWDIEKLPDGVECVPRDYE